MRDQRTKLPFYVRFILLSLCASLLVATASAQEPEETLDPNAAPPPVKVMTKGERSQLDSEQDAKDRTKLALQLMSDRLTRAQTFNDKGEFVEMYNELGGFHALMDYTLDFLMSQPRRSLNVLKRYEMTLRSFAPRLGLIRRELPTEYDPYVRTLLRYLRDARSKAVEPLFGDTVVPQRHNT